MWVAALATAFKLSGRERSPAAPAHPAPAPVVELLRGMRVEEVFHATLFDLARRDWLTIDGDRVSPAAPRAEPLLPYERWVLDRVAARLAGAPRAPVIALMPEGSELDRSFIPLVRLCAIDLGLARWRWPTMIVPVLLVAALVVPWFLTVKEAGVSWPGTFGTMAAFLAGVGLLRYGRGFVPTAPGRELAGPGPVPADPGREWIFTGSGWHGVQIERAPRVTHGPRRQEVAGHVVKRWISRDEEGTRIWLLALHDGGSGPATAYLIKQGVYQDILPGDTVRLLVDVRRGAVVRVLARERHW
ncbi:hypothetical protein ITP53_22790 [Nonomuraea sp. K274]|uniref:Uncharacterized protein n=1 Tax=Nonomuraea cypriaca TaxID=1187855 RepID=A0A931AEB1_9ACTN|nr:hypothetical protein [Nonomuraea cypriaca]MBF8188500.1 hypothetical protein [Nonomuraea cypriaca]